MGTKENPMRDNDKRVQTPRKCIKDYCLMHCERDKRKNSKRDVVECVINTCPLHPYRTGQLKARSGYFSEPQKQRKIGQLERARHLVTVAERDKKLLEEKLQAKKDIVADYENRVRAQQGKIDERKAKVRKLEILFNEQLEAGIWNSNRIDFDLNQSEEEEE